MVAANKMKVVKVVVVDFFPSTVASFFSSSNENLRLQPTFSTRTHLSSHLSHLGPVTPGKHWHLPVVGSHLQKKTHTTEKIRAALNYIFSFMQR